MKKRYSADEWKAAGQPKDAIVTKRAVLEPIVVKNDDGTESMRFAFTLSNKSVDRDTDTIDPDGWDLGPFEKNPVALFAHDHSAPPVGKWHNVRREGDALVGEFEPLSEKYKETMPREFGIGEMVKDGILNAVSVGFIPKEGEPSDDEERPWGVDFKAQELLEVSIVPVPSNRDGLRRGLGLKAFGAEKAVEAPVVETAEEQAEEVNNADAQPVIDTKAFTATDKHVTTITDSIQAVIRAAQVVIETIGTFEKAVPAPVEEAAAPEEEPEAEAVEVDADDIKKAILAAFRRD